MLKINEYLMLIECIPNVYILSVYYEHSIQISNSLFLVAQVT